MPLRTTSGEAGQHAMLQGKRRREREASRAVGRSTGRGTKIVRARSLKVPMGKQNVDNYVRGSPTATSYYVANMPVVAPSPQRYNLSCHCVVASTTKMAWRVVAVCGSVYAGEKAAAGYHRHMLAFLCLLRSLYYRLFSSGLPNCMQPILTLLG